MGSMPWKWKHPDPQPVSAMRSRILRSSPVCLGPQPGPFHRIMCVRFANQLENPGAWGDILEDWPQEVSLGYNIAPTRTVPVFVHHRQNGGTRGLGMRWGLVPFWSKVPAPRFATFNARSESVAGKPAFRQAWKQSQTCLIPALGYYEWTGEKGNRQPWFIRTRNRDPLVMAGLWDYWRQGDRELHSCTILTRSCEGVLRDIHPRIPVMLELNQAQAWLQDGSHHFNRIARQQHPEQLEFYPVSKTVNRTVNEGQHLVKRQEHCQTCLEPDGNHTL